MTLFGSEASGVKITISTVREQCLITYELHAISLNGTTVKKIEKSSPDHNYFVYGPISKIVFISTQLDFSDERYIRDK